MASGFGGNYADVIEWPAIRKLCPVEAKALDDLLDEDNLEMGSFIRFLAGRLTFDELYESDVSATALRSRRRRHRAAFAALQIGFQQATRVGESFLTLHPVYHDSDDGDRYDEIQGGVFHVEGVYAYSPAGERLRRKIRRRWFVTYG